MRPRVLFTFSTAFLAAAAALCAAEPDAILISRNIQARHMPHGTILDPVIAGAEIRSFSRCGDSALWTGHYLAAESFRYAVTKSEDALAGVRRALEGLRLLAEIPGNGVLARCAVPVDARWAGAITSEEAQHGVFLGQRNGAPWFWIGNTSRDQYSGVFFGLATAYDFVEDPAVRRDSADLITRLLNFLLDENWNVVMPNGQVSTSFAIRPDQQLTLLQIGRRVNSRRFGWRYTLASTGMAALTLIPVGLDAIDEHDSYFKFNLDMINFYTLLRLQGGGLSKFWYERAYDIVRGAVKNHGNAHFNIIDRAVNGPDEVRDAETRSLLEAWLRRPRTDVFINYLGQVASCGAPDRACDPLQIELRVRTDFLWQRSPFQIYGGGEGNIETAGIDYILPYWMGRYYGVVQ